MSLTTIEPIGKIKIISISTTHRKQRDKQLVLCFTGSFTTVKSMDTFLQSVTVALYENKALILVPSCPKNLNNRELFRFPYVWDFKARLIHEAICLTGSFVFTLNHWVTSKQ